MDDKSTIYRRGEAASKILGDEAVMSAFGDLERELFNAWAKTNPNRPDDREAIYRELQAMERFQFKLETWRDAMTLDIRKTDQTVRDSKGLGAEI